MNRRIEIGRLRCAGAGDQGQGRRAGIRSRASCSPGASSRAARGTQGTSSPRRQQALGDQATRRPRREPPAMYVDPPLGATEVGGWGKDLTFPGNSLAVHHWLKVPTGRRLKSRPMAVGSVASVVSGDLFPAATPRWGR
jgi:hypothetical protein